MGSSSGINIAGAIRMAQDMGRGHTIITVLCDFGTRYQSKLFNPKFLQANNLPYPEWLATRGVKLPHGFYRLTWSFVRSPAL